MATTFGAPMEDEALQHADPSAAGEGPAIQTIDPDDPFFTGEALPVNVEGEAYAMPPLPPEGRYRVKLKLMQVKNGAGQQVDFIPALWGKNNPQKVLVTGVEVTILDPSGKYDGIHAYDRNVSTFLNQRDNSTKIQTILKLLKRPSGQPWLTPTTQLNPRSWFDLLKEALAGEPELGALLTWRWNCQGCGEEAKKKGEAYPKELRGMAKFPQDADATRKNGGKVVYSSEKKCEQNPAHGYSRASLEVGMFMPVSEVGK